MKKVFNLSLLMAALVMIGLSSCKPNEPKNVAVTSVSVKPTTIGLKVGATQKLTATVAPNNATNKKVTWASSDDKVATVDADGNVKAVANGNANITVTTEDGKKSATCKVTVSESGANYQFINFEYTGGEVKDGTWKPVYAAIFAEAGVVEGGEGKYGAIFLYSNETTVNKNFVPVNGKYSLAAGNVAADSYIGIMGSDKKIKEGTAETFSEAEVTVEANSIVIKAKDKSGTTYDIKHSGEVKGGVLESYQYESMQQDNLTLNFTGKTDFSLMKPIGEVRGVRLVTIADKEKELAAALLFVVPASATNLPAGTYNVSKSEKANTVLASSGIITTEDGKKALTYSFFGKYTAQGWDNPIYFVSSGTVNVTANEINGDIYSFFGSKIKFTYKGEMKPSGVAPVPAPMILAH